MPRMNFHGCQHQVCFVEQLRSLVQLPFVDDASYISKLPSRTDARNENNNNKWHSMSASGATISQSNTASSHFGANALTHTHTRAMLLTTVHTQQWVVCAMQTNAILLKLTSHKARLARTKCEHMNANRSVPYFTFSYATQFYYYNVVLRLR